MQYEYLQNQRETLLDGSFADWVGRGPRLGNESDSGEASRSN